MATLNVVFTCIFGVLAFVIYQLCVNFHDLLSILKLIYLSTIHIVYTLYTVHQGACIMMQVQ